MITSAEWRYKGAVSTMVGLSYRMAVPKDLEELLEAGSHFGHQVRRWNPKMAPYIYATRDGVHVFDLTKTAKLLDRACEYIEEQAGKGKKIVFLGTKRQAKPIVREEAARVGAPVITERWMGGTITNWEEISKRIKKLNEMKQKRDAGEYNQYTKKERTLIDREISRLERFFGGISDFTSIPDILFVVDVVKEKVAVTEAKIAGVAVVAMVDTNADPEGVLHPIPANDDAVRSIKYIVSRIADAYAAGKEKANKQKVHPLYRKDGDKKTEKRHATVETKATVKPEAKKVGARPVEAIKPVVKKVAAKPASKKAVVKKSVIKKKLVTKKVI